MKNVCITGYGAIGPIHASAIEKTENASLYAVCDIDKERLETAKKLYNVKTYTDFDIMLEDKEIDTVPENPTSEVLENDKKGTLCR